jgi:hypothetical protein
MRRVAADIQGLPAIGLACDRHVTLLCTRAPGVRRYTGEQPDVPICTPRREDASWASAPDNHTCELVNRFADPTHMRMRHTPTAGARMILKGF